MPSCSITSASIPYTSRIRSSVTISLPPLARTVPPLMNMNTSEYCTARLMSCMVITVQTPLDLTASTTVSIIMCWLAMSKLLVGSSRMRSSGSCTSALAICTFWNSPPLIMLTGRRDRCSMPRDSSIDHVISRSDLEEPHSIWGRRPMRTESKTLDSVAMVDCGT